MCPPLICGALCHATGDVMYLYVILCIFSAHPVKAVTQSPLLLSLVFRDTFHLSHTQSALFAQLVRVLRTE